MEKKKELQKRSRSGSFSVPSPQSLCQCTCQKAKERPGSDSLPCFRCHVCQTCFGGNSAEVLTGKKGEEEQEAESESSDEERTHVVLRPVESQECVTCRMVALKTWRCLPHRLSIRHIWPWMDALHFTAQDKKALAFRRLQAIGALLHISSWLTRLAREEHVLESASKQVQIKIEEFLKAYTRGRLTTLE